MRRPAGPRGPRRGGLHSLRSAGSRHPLRDPFHDAYVPIGTVAERLESDPIRLRVVCSESFLETIEFNHDHALIDSRLVGFRGVRSHDEASACLLNGRHRELRIRCECILAFDRAIRYDPICFAIASSKWLLIDFVYRSLRNLMLPHPVLLDILARVLFSLQPIRHPPAP